MHSSNSDARDYLIKARPVPQTTKVIGSHSSRLTDQITIHKNAYLHCKMYRYIHLYIDMKILKLQAYMFPNFDISLRAQDAGNNYQLKRTQLSK